MAGEPRRAGVGLVLEARGRGPSFVAELAPGGSADRSGRVRMGDQLLRVDGQTVQGMTPADLSQIISGPEGTAVRLAFRRITSTFFAENEHNFEVSLLRAVPQGLQSVRYAPPASQQPPQYQDVRASMDAGGSYMGDATVLPTNYSSQNHGPGRMPLQQPRRMMEDHNRPTTFNGFSNELPRDSSFIPDQYSSKRNPPIPTSPPQAQRGSQRWEERQQSTITATGTRVRPQRTSAPELPDGLYNGGGESGGGSGGGGEGDVGPDMIVLEEELNTLLKFVKSGYTNATHQESVWMQGDSSMAELMRTIYREIGAIKSREASSENVLRVAKETLDARKKQIRTLTVTLKKLQGQKSLSGMGLSGSMDGAHSQISSDNPSGDDNMMRELQARESHAHELAASTKRKLDRAVLEINDLREKAMATERKEVGAGGEGGADAETEKDQRIQALEEKLRFLEEDHRQRSERITEVSERLMLKRKEERDMIDTLRHQLAEKEDTIDSLRHFADEAGATREPTATVGGARGECESAQQASSFQSFGSQGYAPV